MIKAYLAQAVTGTGDYLVPTVTAAWKRALSSQVEISSRYIEELARQRAEGRQSADDAGWPEQRDVWQMCYHDIGDSDLLIADMAQPNFEYVGVLVEIGLAQAMCIPVFVLAPSFYGNKHPAWRAMVAGYPHVHIGQSIAEVAGAVNDWAASQRPYYSQ